MAALAITRGITKRFPILSWLPGYQAAWLRADLIAGFTAAAVVIPQAMAYATIAGLPVQVGLYVALAPMFIYALLGTSRIHQISPVVLILDCDAISDIEYTALKSLAEFEKRLRVAGITLWLAGLNPQVLPLLKRSPLGKKLGDERVYLYLDQAVETYLKQVGREI